MRLPSLPPSLSLSKLPDMLNVHSLTSGNTFLRLRSADSPSPLWTLQPKSRVSASVPICFVCLQKHISRQKPFGWRIQGVARDGYLRFHPRRGLKAPSAIPGLSIGNLEGPQSVLEAVAILTAIIVVHESGHFLAACLQGIHVSKFAVGFGPILAKFNAKNVEYSIRAFPLGGFVGFPDNDPESDIPVDDVNLLKNRPIFDRVLVISAGVIANIIFAYIIIFVQVLSVGLPVQEALPGVLVPEVQVSSAASRYGLQSGDVIIGVNGSKLPKSSASVFELVDIIKKSPSKSMSFSVERGETSLKIDVVPDLSSDGTGRIGVQLSPHVKIAKVKPENLSQAVVFVGKEFWGLSVNVVESLKQTFFNFSQSAGKVSGPVAIIAVGAEVARSSTDGLYQFAAVLNINLAVINLLPLPALDGGSLFLLLIEAARGGRKIPQEIEQRIMSSGILVVIALGMFLIVRDTLNLDFIREML